MKTEHITFQSAQDGLRLDGLLIAADTPKAVLQIAHGMCEHKERYTAFMEYMAERGFACVIHDHRGHGKSVKKEADLGYFYENGAMALVEDIHQVMTETKKRFPGIPYILMGHSMGSLGVRCFIKKYDSEIDALIVCGSPSKNEMADVGIGLVHLLQKIKGADAHSSCMDKMVMGGFEKPFASEGVKNAWLTTDKAVVEAYNADPYCSYSFTLNGYEALLKLMKNTYDATGWRMAQKNLPIHFFAGASDPCIGNQKKFEQAVSFLKERGYTNVQAKLYDGMRHEILNEKQKAVVYEDMAAFCEKVLLV